MFIEKVNEQKYEENLKRKVTNQMAKPKFKHIKRMDNKCIF